MGDPRYRSGPHGNDSVFPKSSKTYYFNLSEYVLSSLLSMYRRKGESLLEALNISL
jgi:hypothetical protein